MTEYVPDAGGASIGVDYTGALAVDLSPALRASDTLRLTARAHFRIRDGRIVRLVDES